jgi:Predicted hydrolases of the HAD superfamily
VQKEAFLNKMKIKQVDNFLSYVDFPIAKCIITGDGDQLIALEKEMNNHLKGTMGVYRSEPFFLELVPNGIDKAQSLSILLDKLGMTKDEMVACGDGYNDLSMIQFAGLGVAMANAQLVVKEKADFITLSNEEDGVAHVIERFLL